MNKKRFILCLIGLGFLALSVKYSDMLFDTLLLIKKILTPLVIGCAMAYILNIILVKIESITIFSREGTFLNKAKRPISIVCSIGIIFGIFTLIIQIVIPQLIETLGVLAKAIPTAISQLLEWIASSGKELPELEKILNSLNLNWPELIQKTLSHLTNGLTNIFTSTVIILSSVGSFLINFVVALIFAIYILSGKERLFRQFQTLANVYMKEKNYARMTTLLATAHDTFTKFIIGQCVEAFIIGFLCAAGMFLLRFPYASMVGTLIGATALIPVVGAYLGAFIGAFMIFTVSPVKAIGFLIFIVILQQLEGNLIYPKVVGSSVGLPGIWVLAAVTIGGGLNGIIGMLVAVPTTATIYKLLKKDVEKRKIQNRS